MDCPAALERIIEDRPINVKDNKRNRSKAIADSVALIITLMDRINLENYSVDQLYPDMKALHHNISLLLPDDSSILAMLRKWIKQMDSMQASDTFSPEEARQMLHELTSAHQEFNDTLE